MQFLMHTHVVYSTCILHKQMHFDIFISQRGIWTELPSPSSWMEERRQSHRRQRMVWANINKQTSLLLLLLLPSWAWSCRMHGSRRWGKNVFFWNWGSERPFLQILRCWCWFNKPKTERSSIWRSSLELKGILFAGGSSSSSISGQEQLAYQ